MKMLIATAVQEYREKLEQFFSEQNVSFYNELEVKGVDKTGKKQHRVGNWFSYNEHPYNLVTFFTIIDDEQADNIMESLNQCKMEMPNCKIRAYILNIEKSIQ